jgi:hypothetical protein
VQLISRFFLQLNYLDSWWLIHFSPLSDRSVFKVFYVVKYFGGFSYFTSHAMQKWLKNMATLVTSLTKLQFSFCPFGLFCACLLATQANKSQKVLLIFRICEL